MASSDTDIVFGGREGYYPPPHSVYPLPHDYHYGLIVVGICGLASFLSTLTLFSFLAYRFLTWRAHYKTFIGYNQYIVLFLNLVFADLLQATSFLISFYWIAQDAILAPTHACTSQGFLLHFGDVASAFFVFSIAVHTCATAALGKRISYSKFTIGIGVTWFFALFLTIIGLALHGERYFVRAGAWCWVSDDYETERLFCHYLWLFLVQFGMILVYLFTFFRLRSNTSRAFVGQRGNNGSIPNQHTVDAVNRVTKLMMIYPVVYIMLTLPLSSARMWSMAHNGKGISDITACTVGALLASCGWVDCLLYTLTRKRLLSETMGGVSGRSGGLSVSDGKNSDGKDSTGKNTSNSIMQTVTWTVRNDSIDDAPPGLRRSFGQGHGIEHSAAMVMSDAERRPRNKSVGVVSEVSVDRSPSPTGSTDPIVDTPRTNKRFTLMHSVARTDIDMEKGDTTPRVSMRRMPSDASRKGGFKDYELRAMPRQSDWFSKE
jgi:hypothetical protein